jgi:hypothetical protein
VDRSSADGKWCVLVFAALGSAVARGQAYHERVVAIECMSWLVKGVQAYLSQTDRICFCPAAMPAHVLNAVSLHA